MKTSLLLVEILISILVTSFIVSVSNRIAYAHNFSENENALFLTLVHQIEAQTLLTDNNFPTNPKLAEQHSNIAIDLLRQNDPIVNLTWTSQISERNPRIAAELTSALNSLKNPISISQPRFDSTTSNMTSANDIKAKLDMINGLLDEAVSSRLTKEQLNNSTTQALVIANLANKVYFSYGRALGQSPSTMSNMAGMATSVKEASPSSMGMGDNMSMGNNSTAMSSSMAMSTNSSSSSSNSIKNMTQYQTAQALASKAQEIFNKNLKPIASSTLKTANTEIEKDLNRLKAAIDSKAPFIDVMKIVHIQLHPRLITAYHLQLKSFE